MILIVGLTPAWQRVYDFDQLEMGAVNRARAVVECSSGKALNLAVALRLLDAEFRVLSCVGGPVRSMIDREFDSLGIDRRWIETAAPTRTCTTIVDRANHTVTELVENAGDMSAGELAEFREAFADEISKADFLVLTGSLPTGVPPTFYSDLLSLADCSAILDIRGKELETALPRRPLLIKPNREELSATVGRPLPTDLDVVGAIDELSGRGASWIVVTDGGRSGWIHGQGRTHPFQPPRLAEIINPIGCGDALTAGIAAAMHKRQSPLEALRLGLAVAAESATNLLPSRFDPKNITVRLNSIAPRLF